MRLTQNDRTAIYRAIVLDIPKVDRSKRKQIVQDALVKAMSPECRKVFKRTPEALRSESISCLYTGDTWNSRVVFIGDAPNPSQLLRELTKPFEEEDAKRETVLRNLNAAISACTTLKQLEERLPEFKKYFPTAAEPTKNLPALANLVADLTKLGWPKKV